MRLLVVALLCALSYAQTAMKEAQVGQACTWPESTKGRDLKSGQWNGSSKTSLTQCMTKAENAGVSYFAWAKVYGGYCKLLKATVSKPDLSTYQGYGYKLYEQKCSGSSPTCVPREMGGNTGRPAYKVQPIGTVACPDAHLQVISERSCTDVIKALCLRKGSAWDTENGNPVCVMNGDVVEFYDLGGLEQPQIICMEAFASISLPGLTSNDVSSKAKTLKEATVASKNRNKRLRQSNKALRQALAELTHQIN